MNASDFETRMQGTSARTDAQIELAFLPGARLGVKFTPGRIAWPQVVRAVTALGQLPASFRPELEERIYRFYLQEIADGACQFETAQHQLDWEAEHSRDFKNPKAATCSAEVWPLVHFKYLHVSADRSGAGTDVSIVGLAAWDGEHGIVVRFAGGQRLVKVSGHD